MSALSQVVVAPASCSSEHKNEPATYYEWVRRNKAHLKPLIAQSNRANTFGAHERSCKICLQGQALLRRIIAGHRESLLKSSLLKFDES